MSAARPLLNAGTILAGRWQIQDFIGGGETGEVYGVRDMHGSGTFALKLLWPNALSQPELWSAVQQTARTASGLGVEGVARTHDFGIDANSGRPFFVAERVAWSSLADRVRLRGPLTAAEMASALAVIARALDAAHGIGLVHRDLKPENVFVSPENPNWVRVSDFGVALLRAASPPPPGWGGTVGWVAPDAADPNARSTPPMDIFALGLVVFYALSGGFLHRAARSAPIEASALWQELGAPLDSASLRARELGASVDPAFDAWFQRAVSPDPQTRFASVGEMASTFEAISRTLVAPQSQSAVALEGVAAAIAQPLIFQPEPLPPLAAASSPGASPAELANALGAPDSSGLDDAPPAAKKRNAAPLFIGGAVICLALTALGATALYHHHRTQDALPEPSASSHADANVHANAPAPAAEPALSAAPEHAAASAAPTPEGMALADSPARSSESSGTAQPVGAAPPAGTAALAAAATAKPAPTAKAALVSPSPTAAKPTASSAAVAVGSAKPAAKPVASAASTAAVSAKVSTAPAAASAKPKLGTLAAPKKKCGSVFLPCK